MFETANACVFLICLLFKPRAFFHHYGLFLAAITINIDFIDLIWIWMFVKLRPDIAAMVDLALKTSSSISLVKTNKQTSR